MKLLLVFLLGGGCGACLSRVSWSGLETGEAIGIGLVGGLVLLPVLDVLGRWGSVWP